MIVVADTSPLLHLSRVGRLDLVQAALGPVTIPRTVWAELIRPGTRADVRAYLLDAAWITVVDDPPIAGAIDRIAPIIDALRSDGFWLADDLVQTLLQRAGEAP